MPYGHDKALTDYKSAWSPTTRRSRTSYLKEAAAEESFDVFNLLKADMTAKFRKDLEVRTCPRRRRRGNCGLTDCEMTAVCCSRCKFSDYVTKSDRGCVRNDKPVVELCYSEAPRVGVSLRRE